MERCSEEVRNGQLAATCDRYPAEICTYTCDEGFRPNPDTAHIQCSTSGHWNVTTDGLCLVTCPQVLANHNGHADDSCHRVAGQTCALMCNEGYTAAGGVLLEITCGEDGQWKVQGECQGEFNNDDHNGHLVCLSCSSQKHLQIFTPTCILDITDLS